MNYIKSTIIPNDLHTFFTNRPFNGDHSPSKIDFALSNKQSRQETQKNRQMAAESLHFDWKNLFFLNQVHSSKVLLIRSTSTSLSEAADSMVTNIEGIGLAILTADCAPVLFFDPVARVIGAAHAGWRGALYGIIENTVDAMLKMGATKNNIVATVGPCISAANYEVKDDLKIRVIKENNENQRYFLQKSKNSYFFDLSGFIVGNLSSLGLNTTSSVKMCTYDKKNDLHSFRHSQHYGYNGHQRNLSIIKL